MSPSRGIWIRLTAAGVGFALAATAGAETFSLFRQGPATSDRFQLFPESASEGATPVLEGAAPADRALTADAPAGAPPEPAKRCVLVDCVRLPIAPAPKLFTTPVTIWTAAGLLGGFVDGIEGPANYGFHPFHFTDEGYFQSWTYGGGADKASHFVISATVAGLAFDAYRLNGLSPDQAVALSLLTTVVAGAFVEIGDGLTPYGFSAQDLTADTLGATAEAIFKRTGTDDLFGFRIGKVPTTIPAAVLGDRTGTLGLDYTNEDYSADFKLDGLGYRLSPNPGIERFFLTSFVFMTKGYGYAPPIPSRYQQIGFEVGLNFPAILKAVGVSNETWWGDVLIRAFQFVRIPYTQIGAYYNLTNHKWYGPGAPYHYY
jgi:Predicted periplasmic lipoprotein (DUF2279)